MRNPTNIEHTITMYLRSSMRLGGLRKLAVSLMAAGACLAIIAPLTFGEGVRELYKPSERPFTPKLKTFAFGEGTTQAGTPTSLSVEIAKSRKNECDSWKYKYYGPNGVFDPLDVRSKCDLLYIEQNLRDLSITLPEGVLGKVDAAPYCDAEVAPPVLFPEGGGFDPLAEKDDIWRCRNQDSTIGWMLTPVQYCSSGFTTSNNGCQEPAEGGIAPLYIEQQYPYWNLFRGRIYNERPRTTGRYAGEQGHFVMFLPELYDPAIGEEPCLEDPYIGIPCSELSNGGYVRIDLSVRVDTSDPSHLKITTTADDMRDWGWVWPSVQIGGEIGVEYGPVQMFLDSHVGPNNTPFLENSRICNEQKVRGNFTGWEYNTQVVHNPGDPTEGTWELAHGIGKQASDTAPYQATGCEKLPYAPRFSMTASSYTKGTSPALSTTISQNSDEATNKKIQVDIPAGININSTTVPCPADQLAASSCPAESILGEATVFSSFVPKDRGGSVTGNLYLSEIEGSNFKIQLQLRGFIDLDFNGTAGVVDNKMQVIFDDLPSVPIDRLNLNLMEGNQSLLALPKKCGTHDVVANFTSHTGKTSTASSPLNITGCGEPDFDVALSNRGRGKRTSLEMNVTADGENIESVRFALPRYLKINERRLGKASYGELTTVSGKGTVTRKLRKGKRTKGISTRKRGSKKRRSKKVKAKKGALKLSAGSSFGSFSASIFKKKVATGKTVKIRGKRHKVRATKQRMSLKSLPTDSLSRVGVMLNPDERSFIRNPRPKRCKRPLKFLAFVHTNRSYYVVKQEVKLKCGKKKKKKGRKKGSKGKR